MPHCDEQTVTHLDKFFIQPMIMSLTFTSKLFTVSHIRTLLHGTCFTMDIYEKKNIFPVYALDKDSILHVSLYRKLTEHVIITDNHKYNTNPHMLKMFKTILFIVIIRRR